MRAILELEELPVSCGSCPMCAKYHSRSPITHTVAWCPMTDENVVDFTEPGFVGRGAKCPLMVITEPKPIEGRK